MKLKKIFPLFPILLIVVLFIFCIIRAILRPEFYIIIKNGTIVDGLGNTPFSADIGIRRGKIKEIGILTDRKPSKIIDATGRNSCFPGCSVS